MEAVWDVGMIIKENMEVEELWLSWKLKKEKNHGR